MSKTSQSEVHAYIHILKELTEKKGWKKSQIYTQQECRKNDELKKTLELKTPENIINIDDKKFYIIEAKNEKNKLEQALSETKTEYADRINKSRIITCPLVTGIAGNDEENFIAKSQYLKDGQWETITENGIEVTSLLSKQQIENILRLKNPNIKDIEITEQEFLKSAININEILHANAIIKDSRARFISTILLAMSDGQDINTSENTSVLISTINKKVKLILKKHKKEDFSRFIKIDEPSSEDNHIKIKTAIIKTHQELLGLNIRSAMNSGKDVLGKFYEVFLKYGNGAKDLGIVLTPRHITKFSAEILDIQHNDLVLDPACGTGGFLVSAFDEVRKKSTEAQKENFRLNGLYGVEEQDPIIALALVNMIFRGDGKTNMVEGDCFKKWLNTKEENGNVFGEYVLEKPKDENWIKPITKVLMNPPFSKPSSKDKEFKFIEHALEQMQDEGLLFCILPNSNMVKQGQYLKWRKERMLKENTLLAVITFSDIFYPVCVETCGIIIKKGIPHNKKQKVFWARIKNDGFLKSKGKKLPSPRAKNELEEIKQLVKSFIKNQDISVSNIKEFQKASPIDFTDENLELLPQVYLDEKKPTDQVLMNRIEESIKDSISMMVKFDKTDSFGEEVVSKDKDFFSPTEKVDKPPFKEVLLTEIFKNPIKTGDHHVSGILDEGKIPLVSCVSENGGFEGFFKIDVKETIFKNCITIASDGVPLTSFYHYYDFTAKDNALICESKKDYKFTTVLFIVSQLNSLRWRFSYGRKCYENKAKKVKIFLPFNGKEIDEDYINYLFKQTKSWNILEKLFKH